MTTLGSVLSSATIENYTGLSSAVKAGDVARGTTVAALDNELFVTLAVGTYSFTAELIVTTGGATEGIKATVDGTAVASAVVADIEISSHAATPIVTDGRVTSMAGTPIGQTIAGAGGGTVMVRGTITVGTAGTFGISWAQNAHVATNTSVLTGSFLMVWNAAASGSAGATALVDVGVCQGRLTLTTAVPVTTTDVVGAGTIYFTPYNGNRIALYSGSTWGVYPFAELSLALTATSGFNYDVFVYNNSGTLTLETLIWTNDTTRATAIVLQDGVYVKSGATTRRYVGTFRASGTNTTEDSAGFASQAGGKRFLWNAQNRVLRALGVIDTTDTWSYSTSTYRQSNAAAGNQVAYVQGLSLDHICVTCVGWFGGSSVTGASGIGIDSTSASSHKVLSEGGTTTFGVASTAYYVGFPGIGYHYLAWLEYRRSGTVTWYGDGALIDLQSGLIAEVFA